MSAPVITIFDSSNTGMLTSWNVGTIKSQTPTTPLGLKIWNNRAGASDVSDLKECEIMVLDSNGTTYDTDVPKYKWVQVNCPTIDGDDTTYTAIGGSTTKKIKANSNPTDYCIKGTANTGDSATYPDNVCDINIRMEAPINSTPGDKSFIVRVLGYYT